METRLRFNRIWMRTNASWTDPPNARESHPPQAALLIYYCLLFKINSLVWLEARAGKWFVAVLLHTIFAMSRAEICSSNPIIVFKWNYLRAVLREFFDTAMSAWSPSSRTLVTLDCGELIRTHSGPTNKFTSPASTFGWLIWVFGICLAFPKNLLFRAARVHVVNGHYDRINIFGEHKCLWSTGRE